jgi:hypothetical protein
MDVSDYIFALAWFAVSIYLTWVGFSMVTNEKYRHHITRLLFRIDSDAQEQRSRRFVRFTKGPLYIAAGVGLMILGVYLWTM